MPTQGLLNHLYHRGSHSVVGVGWPDYVEPCLTVPEKLVSARELETESKGQRYLEFGVGKGLLYRRFAERGRLCHGVDPGAWAQALTGVVGDVGALPGSLSADVIVALDVLEHISDPIDTLRTLRRFAAPNARLYAAMPNRESIRAKIGRQNWLMLRPLGHVNYWSRRSVMLAFEASGFKVGEIRKTDLFEPPIRTLRAAVKATIEHLGLGDQWIVVARPQ
jgi:SAM-dependent methyltransferase